MEKAHAVKYHISILSLQHTVQNIYHSYLFRLGCPKVYLDTQVVTLLMPLHTTLKEIEVLIMCPYVWMLHIHLELGKGFWSESPSWTVFQLVLLLLVSGQLQVPSKLLCYQLVTKKNLCISTYKCTYMYRQWNASSLDCLHNNTLLIEHKKCLKVIPIVLITEITQKL